MLLAPLLVFVCLYVATLLGLAWLRFPSIYWGGLISASVATAGSIALLEKGRWPLGLFVRLRLSIVEGFLGCAWGMALIGAGSLLVVLTTDLHHVAGRGFPWREVALVFIPAVVHEELLFRGYPFQKLHRWNRAAALLGVAAVFAALHAGNAAVTVLGLTNIFLGGLLLGLAWERYRRLWFPIGVHLGWNVMTGPVLGHEVSGYDPMLTLLVERGTGPEWLTGGEFGIEGSAVMTAVELAAVWLLWRRSGEGLREMAAGPGGGASGAPADSGPTLGPPSA